VKVVLISTYELGHQPFGLASPAAWLRRAGHEVSCIDTSQQALRDHESAIGAADAIAFYVPMHTATRIAMHAIRRARALNSRARLCAYGLYAPLNAELLVELGVGKVIGGEFERELVEWVTSAAKAAASGTVEYSAEALRRPTTPVKLKEALNGVPTPARDDKVQNHVSLDRLQFITPERAGLPALRKYAKLRLPSGEERVSGYTEASRGCQHLCRHCPIVPVYNGTFRVVQREVVLADIRQQVEAGAQHITFGDPDFFNGPTHAVEIVKALHREFPDLSYDATIKVEHLLKHEELLPVLKSTGCGFIVTAVESFQDSVLVRLAKGHTKQDFIRTLESCRRIGLNLSPTFVAFTPWTTLESYKNFLGTLAELDLVPDVPSIQLVIRLLIPAGSKLLEIPDIRERVGGFDRERLFYPWSNKDPRVDELQEELETYIASATRAGSSRSEIFSEVHRRVAEEGGSAGLNLPIIPDRATIPYLTEPWYC
jgi:radical SAM superfamily enzyme YgiQ (UPF0313 family)